MDGGLGRSMTLSPMEPDDKMTPMSTRDDHGDEAIREPQATAVMEVIARRVSRRAYKTDPVPEEYLDQILEAARLAPSACNAQPWRFALVQTPEIRRQVVARGFLPGIKMDWAMDAPVHVVIGIERSLVPHRLGTLISGVDYPWVDIGIAGEHLVLAATALGLGTCWIGWIRPRALARVVGWPRSVRPAVVITVGYPKTGMGGPRASCRKELGVLVRRL